MITFTRQHDGTFKQEGECSTNGGRFEWFDGNRWDGGWCVEPVARLLSRMNLSGPYKYEVYRIVEATAPELVIKPTCAGCGTISAIDCQRSVEYLFGKAVLSVLPIEFNTDKQFSLSIAVVTDGKNFNMRRAKSFWFNSIRCAELLLMENGYCEKFKKSKEPIGTGKRLLGYLNGNDNPDALDTQTKRRRASKKAKDLVWAGTQPLDPQNQAISVL